MAQFTEDERENGPTDAEQSAFEARARQCGRKVIYPDEVCAKRAAKLMHKRHKAPFDAYACTWCHGWHTGRRRKKEAAIRRSERRAA